jgi:hypothetical protein
MSVTSVSTAGMPTIGTSVHGVFGPGRQQGQRRNSSARFGSRRSILLTIVALVAFAVAATGIWVGVRSSSILAATVSSGGEVQVLQADGSDEARVMSSSDPALFEHLVVPGDTLWALAVSVGGDADPRAYIDRVQRLNGLSTAALPVGRVVLLPAIR